MDIFTTCLKLAGVKIPDDRPIDGKDLIPVLKGEEKSTHKEIYYYNGDELCAVRSGKYKLHFKMCSDKWEWEVCEPPELYDLEYDPSEKYDISQDNPIIVKKLYDLANKFKLEIEKLGENKKTINTLMNRN